MVASKTKYKAQFPFEGRALSQHGRIALVGSGEYLPEMAEFESTLLKLGGTERYVQIPTAAGQESNHRLNYWQELGRAQAERIGAKPIFLPIFERSAAMSSEFASEIEGAGLIYLSGGDPHYLAETLLDTPVFEAIISAWRSGASLAGCSAGAMVLGPDIPHFRKMKEEGTAGFSVVPNIRTIPHYNKFFRWIPEIAAQRFLKAPEHINIVGIDEMTAIYSDDLSNWNVYGQGKLHILTGETSGIYQSGDNVTILN